MICYREMRPEEIARIAEIDRSDRVTHAYVQHGAEIMLEDVDWDVPTFAAEGDHGHTIPHKVAAWRAVAEQGQTWGAFEDERLMGIGILRRRLEGDMAELAVLHVDRAHRCQGIGRQLSELMFAAARASGATSIYVSGSPVERAVRFYLSLGFKPTATPHPRLLADEPEDIHMTRAL
jgi:GNAT superfamily N-acetyltransferase